MLKYLLHSTALFLAAISSVNAEPSSRDLSRVDKWIRETSASLPRKLDDASDLMRITRMESDIVFIVKVRPHAQAEADNSRRFAETDDYAAVAIPRAADRRICETELKAMLQGELSIIIMMFDGKGLLRHTRTTLADCSRLKPTE